MKMITPSNNESTSNDGIDDIDVMILRSVPLQADLHYQVTEKRLLRVLQANTVDVTMNDVRKRLANLRARQLITAGQGVIAATVSAIRYRGEMQTVLPSLFEMEIDRRG